MFVNGKEIHKFKAKDSEIVATPLCLGNISKDWSVHNTKKLDQIIHAQNPCAKLCVPDVVKNLNFKLFNLVSGTNETSRIE